MADLFDQYGSEIYGYVRLTVGSTVDAEDLVQEIFLRALSGWAKFRRESSARTWLWAITRHVLQEHFRQRERQRRLKTQLEATEHHTPARSPDVNSRLVLEEALASLPDGQRRVFVLRVIQDRPSQEVARMLGWSDVRVRVALFRALRSLKAWWEDRGGVVDDETP